MTYQSFAADRARTPNPWKEGMAAGEQRRAKQRQDFEGRREAEELNELVSELGKLYPHLTPALIEAVVREEGLRPVQVKTLELLEIRAREVFEE
mgnify:CR=1 FL=1